LRGADIRGALLGGADFSGALLSAASISEGALQKARNLHAGSLELLSELWQWRRQ